MPVHQDLLHNEQVISPTCCTVWQYMSKKVTTFETLAAGASSPAGSRSAAAPPALPAAHQLQPLWQAPHQHCCASAALEPLLAV